MSEQKFISLETKKILKEGLKQFPDDFIYGVQSESLELPKQKLQIGKEFFGNFEILTADGTPIFQVNDIFKAKFIIYSSKIPKEKINIPQKDFEIKIVVETYEKYLDSILKRIHSDIKNEMPHTKNLLQISNDIFRRLNLIRI